MGEGMARPKSPSPLWGGVRGGGKAAKNRPLQKNRKKSIPTFSTSPILPPIAGSRKRHWLPWPTGSRRQRSRRPCRYGRFKARRSLTGVVKAQSIFSEGA